jgi:transcription elongation factor GreA
MTVHLTNGRVPSAPLMTSANLRQLRAELDQLRRRTRVEVAQGLREARSYGEGMNNDEYHAAREEQLVLEARLASLEDTIEAAVVIDPDDYGRGAAVIGSTVLIEDLTSGAVCEHRLTSAHQPIGPDTISAASPIGQAIMGATPGTVVTVELPNGRSRSVRLVDVRTREAASPEEKAAA